MYYENNIKIWDKCLYFILGQRPILYLWKFRPPPEAIFVRKISSNSDEFSKCDSNASICCLTYRIGLSYGTVAVDIPCLCELQALEFSLWFSLWGVKVRREIEIYLVKRRSVWSLLRGMTHKGQHTQESLTKRLQCFLQISLCQNNF